MFWPGRLAIPALNCFYWPTSRTRRIDLSIWPSNFRPSFHSYLGNGFKLREFNYLPVRPLVSLCARYRSSVTGIFPLLDQLQGLMFSRYPVAYAFYPTTRRWNFTTKDIRVFTAGSYSLHVMIWKASYTCFEAVFTSQRVAHKKKILEHQIGFD
mgnify:CR=1 FL=1